MKYKLNSKQNFYYLRAILGLGVYTRDEINSLGYQKKKRIIKVHRKATLAIEKLKQQRLHDMSSAILSVLFNKGKMFEDLTCNLYVTFEDVPSINMSDKNLGISKDDILECLLEHGVLGPNFLKLE